MGNCFNCKFEKDLKDAYFVPHETHCEEIGGGFATTNKNTFCDYYEPKEEPKEEEKVIAEAWCKCGFTKNECTCEKLYTTGQMIDMLAANLERKAFDSIQGTGHRIMLENGMLIWENSKKPFELTFGKRQNWDTLTYREWGIIEPEPKKIGFAEVVKQFLKNNPNRNKSMRSVVTGAIYRDLAGLVFVKEEEIDGEWNILD